MPRQAGTVLGAGPGSGPRPSSETGTGPTPGSGEAKARLLDAVILHFTTNGLADQSLRRIAEAVGSSHRMLLYHFGSKDGLLLEVVREVEARTQSVFAAIGDAAAPERVDELIRQMWHYVADPAVGDFERLFFALYGRALQGDAALRPLLRDDVETWVRANVSVAATGVPEAVARAHARLGLAVTRGLLLDLLATGDRTGVEAALEVFARRYRGRWWEDQAEPDGVGGAGSGTSDRAS
jgi:AcrR family transcriptional regulator